MSSHTPERRPFGSKEPKSPSEPLPPPDEGEAAEESGRGALFDGSFRERLRARRAVVPPASAELEDHETSVSEDQREGLPPGFRMRHDRHYVDELSAQPASAPLRYLDIGRLRTRQPLPRGEGLGTLIASIRELGLVQPLVVRPRGHDFEVVAGAKRLAAASAAGLRTLPCVVQDLDDLRAERVAEAARVRGSVAQQEHRGGEAPARPPSQPARDAESTPPEPTALSAGAIEEIEKSLRSIVSSVEMMRSAPGELLERAARDLMAAEAYRCDWLVRASRRLQSPHLSAASDADAAGSGAPPRRNWGAVDLPALVERQIALLEPENRLLGVETQVSLPREELLVVRSVEGDLATAVEGVLRSLLAGLAESRGGQLHVEVNRQGSLVALRVHQDLHGLPPELADRFFDHAFAERPGGVASATGLASARQTFEDYGGTLQLLRADASGPLLGQGFGVLGRLPLHR